MVHFQGFSRVLASSNAFPSTERLCVHCSCLLLDPDRFLLHTSMRSPSPEETSAHDGRLNSLSGMRSYFGAAEGSPKERSKDTDINESGHQRQQPDHCQDVPDRHGACRHAQKCAPTNQTKTDKNAQDLSRCAGHKGCKCHENPPFA